MRRVVGITVLLVGCQAEYSFPGDAEVAWGDPNPRDLAPSVQVDRVLQVVEPYIDILWVIDASPSMFADREALAEAFPAFIAPFEEAEVDFHIGVITTDMETEGHMGQLQERQGVRWLDRDTPDLTAVFTAMTTQGLDTPTLEERGREAAWTALELQEDGFNAGFFRDDEAAYLHLTVVSDEDDDTDDNVVSVGRFAEYLDFVRPYTERTTFNSVVALTDQGPEERGDAYIALTEAVGGSVFDIHGGSWTTLLDELSGLQAPEPMTEFFLSRLPVPDSLDVKVVDPEGVTFVYVQDVDYSFVRARNSVLFLGDPPAIGSAIEVEYIVSAEDPG